MFDHDIPSNAGPLADPNGPWPPATPAEIPLSALEIKATGILLRNWLARYPLSHSTKTIADHPEVARRYLPELNGGIPANRIPCFLGIDVVWRCDAVPGEVHLWSAKPKSFTHASLTSLEPGVTPKTVVHAAKKVIWRPHCGDSSRRE